MVKSRAYPCVETAFERAHAREAPVHQQAGDTRRAGFVRSRTVNDNVSIRRQLRHMRIEIRKVDTDGSRHAARIDLARRRRAHINNHRRPAFLHHTLKVFHGDARHAQDFEKPPAFAPLDADEQR